MALDVGTKRIGVAISDPSQSLALPLTVLQRSNVKDDVHAIVQLMQEYESGELVVGDPVTLAGERGLAARDIDAFVERLRRMYSGPIHRVDERLTTAQATKTLIAADVRRSKRKAIVDKMAAALILETFLARKRNSA